MLIVEVQYLYDLLIQKSFDSFHHEHIAYYTASSIKKVLEAHKLYVFDAERLKVHGGMLRVYVSLNKQPITKKLKKILSKEDDKNIIAKINNLNSFRIKFSIKVKRFLINLKKQKKMIYGMGAAPRACVMLNSCNLVLDQQKLSDKTLLFPLFKEFSFLLQRYRFLALVCLRSPSKERHKPAPNSWARSLPDLDRSVCEDSGQCTLLILGYKDQYTASLDWW